MQNNSFRPTSYVAQLPINLQTLIMKDLVEAGIQGEDLEGASCSRLTDLEDTINIKPYIEALNDEALMNRKCKDVFFISDLEHMKADSLEELTTLKYVLDVRGYDYEVEVFHDVYEYGKYYMIMLHFYKGERPQLSYDDDSEEIVKPFPVHLDKRAIHFDRAEVTLGKLGETALSFKCDGTVSHMVETISCDELEEHFIFAVHRYTDYDPHQLVIDLINDIL